MPSPQAVPYSRPTLEALKRETRHFPLRVRDRGEAYARTRVGAVAFGSHDFSASVRGSGTARYRTGWYLENGDWLPDCTCPASPYCKHAYALALVVLRSEAQTTAAGGGAGGEQSALEVLQTSNREWEREHALGLLLADAPTTISAYLPPFPEILRERDPDMLCWQLAQAIAQKADGWLPAPLEPFRNRPDIVKRETERERAGLARQLQAWVRQQRRGAPRSLRLVLRLEGPDAARAKIVFEPRLTSPRVADAPRSAAQLLQLRNDIRNGNAQLSHAEMALLDWLLEVSTATYALGGTPVTKLRALLAQLADSGLVTWGAEENDGLARCAGIVDGRPARLRPEEVSLLPTLVAREGESALELRLVWPDGSHCPLDEVAYVRGGISSTAVAEPSLVIRDGIAWTVVEEPPFALIAQFARAGFLPIAPEERAATIGLLSRSFPALRPALATYTRHVDAAPVVAMDLRNDDWLQIRLFAHTGGGTWSPSASPAEALVFEYGPERLWQRVTLPAPGEAPAAAPVAATATGEMPADDLDAVGAFESMTGEPAADPTVAPSDSGAGEVVWIEEPLAERVQPAADWIERVRTAIASRNAPQEAPWSDRDTGWWVLVNRKRLATLAEAWEDRPAGIGFFGTPRIRRLFTGRDTIKARVRVVASGVDWLSVSTAWEAEGRRLSDDDLAALRAASGRFVKLPSGWVRREVVEAHDETAQLLADVGIEVGEGEQSVNLWQLVGARSESLEALERFGADPETIEAVRRMRERIASFEGLPRVPLPEGLTAELRPYQRHGLDFLAYCSALGAGTLLADDMGLGKTVQALAWLLHLRSVEPGAGPSLVVCPASVVHNWAREAERFTPGLRVLMLTSGKERHELRKTIGEHDLVVTNYALLRRDAEEWHKLELHAAILDEAQNIKNPDAVVTRAARELRARHRLALTGTPLENRALDLWSILSFANPGYLGNRAQFSARYDRSEAPPHLRALLAARLRPILLRRTKAEVAPELPDRIEERVDCVLSRGQRQLYLAELRRSRRLLQELARDPDELKKNRITILAALTRLRQICCHPALAGGKPALGSGKFDTLFDLLEPLLAEGHKVLVFSQFVECLKLLSSEMRERGLPHHILTGQTTRRERVVAAFEQDPRASVFLISLKAGGTGLNLTSASYVVVFDPWWNPAVEAQAIDRTHRIGQTRTVIAYRLLTLGTIEEKIFELQQRKAQLVRDVLGEGGFARALTREDFEYLLTPEEYDDDEDDVDDLTGAWE